MKKSILFSLIGIICLVTSCKDTDISANAQYIPPVPDYSNTKMWYNVLDRSNADGADVFYIPSTWEFDWTTSDGITCHYADINNQDHLDNMSIEMKKVSDYMADGNRFYSPFYRHITLDTWATLNNDNSPA